jgi:hypothetical protein
LGKSSKTKMSLKTKISSMISSVQIFEDESSCQL